MSEERTSVVEAELTAAEQATSDASELYNPENVQVLRDAAHIRRRPGVYIGDVGPTGLHHLVFELVYNSVDEFLAGHCHNMQVQINLDGSLSVNDDGRGIPVEMHPEVKRPTLEVVMTTLGAGAKFDKRTYKTSAGLHGMGAKAVTALSEWTEAEVRRDGHVYMQEYERGKAVTEVKEMGAAKRTGTKIKFKPDPEIFHEVKFDYDRLESRLRELAFLNKGLTIKLADERTAKEETFFYAGGVSEFVEYLNRSEETIHKPIYIDQTVDEIRVELAFQYTTGEEERVRCYANNAFNAGGGTHLSGFRAGLTRTLNSYAAKEGLLKNDLELRGEDFREGVTGIISMQVPEPQFESQTKIRLNNPEVEGIVASVVNEHLAKYLEENPKDAKKIMNKVILAAEAREAAAKAKKALKDRKSMLNSGGLPGKLMDCTSNERDESELFLVEGKSAAASAANGRNRHIQALLPLRGKVLNVEKARVEKVLSNEEICNLISAVGVDIGNSEDITGLRYGKIILLTDADVDGQHIRTLLLTFFYRQMKKLIEDGFVYVARPPLFKVTQKKNIRYVQTIEEMSRELMQRGLDGTKLTVAHPDDKGKASEKVQLFEGDHLKELMAVLDELERDLQILERRGLSVAAFFNRQRDGELPTYRVLLGGQELWFFSPQERDAFIKEEQQRQGRELVVADEATAGNGQGNGHADVYSVQELHEVRGVNRGLKRLRDPKFALLPPPGSGSPPRPGRRRPQDRRARPGRHALQGPRRNGRRGALGNHPRPRQAHSAPRPPRRRPQSRRDVPDTHGRKSRAAPRVHPETRFGGQGDRLPRGVIQLTEPRTGWPCLRLAF